MSNKAAAHDAALVHLDGAAHPARKRGLRVEVAVNATELAAWRHASARSGLSVAPWLRMLAALDIADAALDLALGPRRPRREPRREPPK